MMCGVTKPIHVEGTNSLLWLTLAESKLEGPKNSSKHEALDSWKGQRQLNIDIEAYQA